MPSPSQRAQSRVKYPVDVRLLVPTLDRAVTGRSVNLSPSGIFVEASDIFEQPFEIGAKLVCEIPLPGGTRRLAGQVARTQTLGAPGPGVGLGIRFVDLDRAAVELLQNLVKQEPPAPHLVRARFDGMNETLRSQAVLTEDGLRLSTALPFLRPGAEVNLAFVAGASRVLSRGLIREIQVEPRQPDGIPRVSLHVQLPRRGKDMDDGAPDDREEITAVDTPRGIAAAAQPATAAVTAAARAPASSTRAPGRARRRPLAVRGRPRRPAMPTRETAAAPATETIAAPANLVTRAVKVAAYVAGGLALVTLGSLVTRLSMRAPVAATAPAATGPTNVEAAAPTATGPANVATEAPVPTAEHAAVTEARADEPPPPANLPSSLRLPWRQQHASATAIATKTAPAAETAQATAPARETTAPAEAPSAAEPAAPAPPPREAPTIAAVAPPPAAVAPAAAAAPARPSEAASDDAPARPADQRDSLGPNGERALPRKYLDAHLVAENEPGPEMITADSGEITAVIPIAGSADGMTQFTLAEPRGVAVTLPNAQAVLAFGRHRANNRAFRSIWIRPFEHGGIQIRFTLAQPAPEVVSVDVVDGAVKVRVAPPR